MDDEALIEVDDEALIEVDDEALIEVDDGSPWITSGGWASLRRWFDPLVDQVEGVERLRDVVVPKPARL